jgi:acetyltransferase-like isoleucine patch superfamily enzyme
VLVASTHDTVLGQRYIHTPWDESRSGVDVGANVWIGAQCVLVAGVVVGDDAVIAAGAVVTKNVPAGEIWAGVPARKLRDVPRYGPRAHPQA